MKTTVEMKIKNDGSIFIELDDTYAPLTVENFLKLVDDKFYDGLTFHRVIPGFMVQGGCPQGTGMGGPGYEIKGEFSSNGVENPMVHHRGVISMARAMNPDSAGSQFFIMVADAPHLDGQYASFGAVTKGMDVVDRIVSVQTNRMDKPLEDVVIESVTRV
ncbi:peptidylprolyl isomerase [Erysipelothrix larvae]|uniref:Peptidyl-prolyl cis-trans isomerase n=1 Tax=Erysipelothrix larvae TaxID=1514105 RepID=A0A0X8GZK0_9FIRM|nr:peptidylprolyl isomerase [Erysipelothrix larvae]AMC93134.1 peptidylprolyl isomerase [Erysipelothrix larvae]